MSLPSASARMACPSGHGIGFSLRLGEGSARLRWHRVALLRGALDGLVHEAIVGVVMLIAGLVLLPLVFLILGVPLLGGGGLIYGLGKGDARDEGRGT